MTNKIVTLLFFLLPFGLGAQTLQTISYSEYINKVRQNNLAYAAEKLNIPMAEAEVTAAKVFNDPTLSGEYGHNDHQMGQSYSVELSKTFTFGTRGASIKLAKSEKEVTEKLLENFLNELIAEATRNYYEAIRQNKLYEVALNSYRSIQALALGDSIKFRLGKITEVDAMQSRVEEGIVRNELLATENEMMNAYRALNIPLGRFSSDTLYVAEGQLAIGNYVFAADSIVKMAVEQRADLVASLKNIDVAKRALTLAHREKNMEFDLSVGYGYNSEVKNEIAPSPQFNGVTVGVAIPLKFSSMNRATIRSAKCRVQQAEHEYDQAKLEVQTEVMQNYQTYLSTGKQLERFDSDLMLKSAEVLRGKIYSYNRGESSLLEVLTAQSTYNDVRTLYIESQYNHALALVNLEQSIGIWDIEIK